MTWWMWLIGIAHTAVYVWAFWRKKSEGTPNGTV
jgi:hypothetical protein